MAMNRRAVKVFVLLWFGWYLSGPVAETIDFWDPPAEEMRDVLRNAGGTVVLVAAAVCIGILLLRKSRALFRQIAELVHQHLSALNWPPSVCPLLTLSVPTHSPPLYFAFRALPSFPLRCLANSCVGPVSKTTVLRG